MITDEDGDLYGILKKPNIREVQFGMDKRFPTWYGSAVYFSSDYKTLGFKDPEELNSRLQVRDKDSDGFWLDTLCVCEYCFKYTDDELAFKSHIPNCPYKKKAPGRIKYKSPQYTIRRVKGSKHQLFCQCLCLFTKLFLDNKSMYFKVDHYEFYIIYETGSTKPMAFFSKDLLSYAKNNLACILTFPPYQRRRLGTLLIDFSYKLSIHEGILSGPEQPLSPFGLCSYLKYWSSVICWQLLEGDLSDKGKLTLSDIADVTGMRINDIIIALEHLNCLNNEKEISLAAVRAWARENATYDLFMLQDEYLFLDD